jgi:hypothetical protein
VSVKLAIASSLLLVLVAGTVIYYAARRTSPPPPPAAKPQVTPSVTAIPTPTLGPYGHIASRQSDPKPLTVAELFPASFISGGVSYARTAGHLSGDCLDAVTGANIQAAISSGSCTQAARATYMTAKKGMMGTIGVFNMRTVAQASASVRAADASDFVTQLPGAKGPTSKITQGPGVEEALAKGHYLILIWAGFTSRRTPHTTAQKQELATFMKTLLQGTANVSLTDRMVNGKPS